MQMIMEPDARGTDDSFTCVLEQLTLSDVGKLYACSKFSGAFVEQVVKKLSDNAKERITNNTWFPNEKSMNTFLLTGPACVYPFLEAVRNKRTRWSKLAPIIRKEALFIENARKRIRSKRSKIAKSKCDLESDEETLCVMENEFQSTLTAHGL